MQKALMIGALIGATLLAYHPSLTGQFVYDDKAIILRNQLICDLHQWPLILATPYWGVNVGQPKEFRGGLYRPLTIGSFALNYFSSGLDPKSYHLTNILLHIGVALLLGALCLQLGLSPSGAWAASFLFALLPIHTEAVCNVVGRSEVLAAFFVLASWIAISRRATTGWHLLLGAVFYLFALLSKESAAAFLGVVIVADHVLEPVSWRHMLRTRLLNWVVYAGILFLYLEWRYLILGHIFNIGGIPYFDAQAPLVIFLTMAKFTVQHYLWPLVSGTALSAEYTRPALADSGLEDLAAWGCAFALSGFVAFSIYHTFKYRNRAAFCVVLFLILLLPASNLLVRLEVIGAERFLYLPSIGFCIALGFLVDAARRGEGIQRIGGILLIILGLWYGFCTYERSNVWRTEESFWKTTVQDAPQSPRSWNGWGVVLMNQRKLDEAINAFTKALGLNRMLLDADYNLATCFFLKGNYATAMRGYLYVAQAKPNDLDTLYHLAMIAEHEKGFRLAAAYYERILRINSLDRTALRNLILDHCRMGNIPACRVELEGYLHGALPEENNNDLRVFLQKLPR